IRCWRCRRRRPEASVRAFFDRELAPHVPDAWIDTSRRDPRDGRWGSSPTRSTSTAPSADTPLRGRSRGGDGMSDEQRTPCVWIVRAGKHGEDEETALERGLAIIGFTGFDDLARYGSLEDM